MVISCRHAARGCDVGTTRGCCEVWRHGGCFTGEFQELLPFLQQNSGLCNELLDR